MEQDIGTSERRYTEKQFCEMYRIDRGTAHKWRKSGIISYIKLSMGRIRYLQSPIDEMERKFEQPKKGGRK